MPQAFTRTASLLQADGFRGSAITLAIAAALGAGWIWWFFQADVPLYEVSGTARLETNLAAYVVQSPVAGKLLSADLPVGRKVKVGDELARVEASLQRLQTGETRTRMSGLASQIIALREELNLSEKAAVDERVTTQSAIEVARQQLRGGEAPLKYLEAETERLRKLQSQGLIADRELQRNLSDAAAQRAAVDGLRLAIQRLEKEQTGRESERRVRQQSILSNISRLEAEIQNSGASLGLLEYEMDRRVIRAPVSGEIGESAVLRPGAVLAEGQKLAAIVPSGGTILVAQFPAAAMGRIQAGQGARIRLQGFPWMQYGTLLGKVERVGSEVRDGTVRVELGVRPETAPKIPMQHGLPGSVEVQVERTTPAELAMRLAGGWLTTPREGRGGPATTTR